MSEATIAEPNSSMQIGGTNQQCNYDEGLGFVGRREGILVTAVVLLL